MDTVIVVSVVTAAGVLCAGIALSWPLYVKPKLRQRYERRHHRSKGNTSRTS